MSINLLYICIHTYIHNYIYINSLTYFHLYSILKFISCYFSIKGKYTKIMNQFKVSIKAKNTFFQIKKLMNYAPNPYGGSDDMPFCNNFKLSIFHSVLEIIYLFSYRKCQNIYYRTLSFMNLAPRNISAD